MLIVEFVNGPNLLHFLRKHRPKQPDSAPSQLVQQRQPITEGRDGEGAGNNLLHFLRKHRPTLQNSAPSQPLQQRQPIAEGRDHEGAGHYRCLLSWQELASLALQVAKGMEHLAAFKVRIE